MPTGNVWQQSMLSLEQQKFCARGSRPSSTWRLQVQIVFSTCTSKMYNCTVKSEKIFVYCESEKIKTLSQAQLSASHVFVNLQKPVVAKFIIHQQTWNFPISCLLITWLPFDILKSFWYLEKLLISWKTFDILKTFWYLEKLLISWKAFDNLTTFWYLEKLLNL